MYEYWATVERVVDGDTVDARIDLGFDTAVYKRLRLFGIDAPEVRGPGRDAGLAAKAFLAELVEGKQVAVHTIRDTKEKYGRYLAKLYMPDVNDLDVCAALVQAGHAEWQNYE